MLQRAFAEAGQTSFRTYLRAVRMEHAEELLREDSLRVWEAAEPVGYSQPAVFAKGISGPSRPPALGGAPRP